MAKKRKKRKQSPVATTGERRSARANPAYRRDQADSPTRSAKYDWIRSIAIAIGLALLIRWPVIEPYKIPSGSMEPTLHGDERFLRGDRIFVNKYHYGVRLPFNGFRIPFTNTDTWYAHRRLWNGSAPQRWDMVVFKAVEEGVPKHTLVKRIVGLPGERVEIREGKIWIDGLAVDTPKGMSEVYYTTPPPIGNPAPKYGLVDDDQYTLIPEGHYLVLGDNSARSRDGRYFGWLPDHNILGRVTCIWWPIDRWNDFTGFTQKTWWRSFLVLLASWIFFRLFLGRSWFILKGYSGAGVEAGDHLYVNRLALGIPVPFSRRRLTRGKALNRGEVVLYSIPKGSDPGPALHVGMIAGLPQEDAYLDGGALQIDKESVELPASLCTLLDNLQEQKGLYGRSKSKEFCRVPENHYYILTDGECADGRALGWISRQDVVGTVRAVWWPLRRVRRLPTPKALLKPTR